jgi:hypothetical protein
MASLSLNKPLLISFGRGKEWNYWFLLSSENDADHRTNFSQSAEEQVELENSIFNDVTFLENIVDDLIQHRNYAHVSFPSISLSLDEDSWLAIVHELPSFPVIHDAPIVLSAFLVFYSRNEYWDKFKLDLFLNSQGLSDILSKVISEEMNENPALAPLELHSLIIARMIEKEVEPVEFDHLEFHNPTRHQEGLSHLWDSWLGKDYLIDPLANNPIQQDNDADSPF